MTEYRKTLIEVALPLKAINVASAKEKSIRHGHPSTLHLWWARRPLATCRAMLFASLINDPSDDPMYGISEDIAANERAKLFNLIEELVLWENSDNPRVINAARAEIARSIAANKVADGVWKNDQVVVTVQDKSATADDFKHKLAAAVQVNAFLVEHAPPVLDPFCGGGSIPLEAQRLGLRAYASDLNPVPVLITKALIEIPQKFAGRPPVSPAWQTKSTHEKAATVWRGAQGLAEDVRHYGKWVRDEAIKRIGQFYPKVTITAAMAQNRPDLNELVGHDLTVIAWIWARTVASPNPACNGAHVPLVRSFWLSTKKDKQSYIRPVLDQSTNTIHFTVCTGEVPEGFDPSKGTVVRIGARCLLSGSPVSFDHIRAEGKAGRLGSQLMALVAEGPRGRIYLPPVAAHSEVALSAQPSNYPDTELPKQALSMRVMLYGIDKHYKLFTARQLVALTTLSDLVKEARERVFKDTGSGYPVNDPRSLENGGNGSVAYADAVMTYLAFGLDKNTVTNCTLATWQANPDRLTQALGRQALPMTWDYAEANPLSEAGGGYILTLDSLGEVLERLPSDGVVPGQVFQLDATAVQSLGIGDVSFSTDPPYYDNIGYADLSDWFYVWMRKTMASVWPSLFSTLLTPKSQELIATPFRHDGSYDRASKFFEDGLHKVFKQLHHCQRIDTPLTVFYAFKQAEENTRDDDDEVGSTFGLQASTGWETMLEGLLQSGFAIVGTWPVRTELVTSLKKSISALASSVVLVCRPRPDSAPLATRKDFLAALRRELPNAFKELQHGNIAPVDLAQAAIGPGMGVFSRYAKVVESDGTAMTVRTALGIINQVLDEALAEQEGEFDADTRWALAWFEQFGTKEDAFGVAETLSKAKNTAVNGLVEAGIIKTKSGKVQLVSRAELPDDWNPATDKRLTVWETVQHLIRTLETKGEGETASLLNRLGGVGETARDLAYRLYSICERKKWADEALAYNGLVIAWPELSKLALATRNRQPSSQQDLFS